MSWYRSCHEILEFRSGNRVDSLVIVLLVRVQWETMINIQLDLVSKDPLTGNLVPLQQKIPLQSSASTMKLNPAAILAANPALGSKPIYGFHANIDCDKA